MNLKEQAYNAAKEIIEIAGLKKGQILVVGCSTSEILGAKIGTDSSPDTAKEVLTVFMPPQMKRACLLPRNAANTLTEP